MRNILHGLRGFYNLRIKWSVDAVSRSWCKLHQPARHKSTGHASHAMQKVTLLSAVGVRSSVADT